MSKRQMLSSPNATSEMTSTGSGIVDFEAILSASNQVEMPLSNRDYSTTASCANTVDLNQGQTSSQQEQSALGVNSELNRTAGALSSAIFSAASDVSPSLNLNQIISPSPTIISQPQPSCSNNSESNLSGQELGINPLRCGNDSIFLHVPKSLQQQICKGEYINLALLLKGGMELKEFCSGGALKLNSEGGIEMKPKVCKEKIQSIEKWTDAFLIYASVYLTAHQDKTNEILHYIFLIREAALKQKGSFCWRDYDEQFRIRQANSPSSWSVINNDLWWRCMQVRAAEPTNQAAGNSAVTKSYSCNDFNKGTCHWPFCRFPHLCSNCGSTQHGAASCINKQFNAPSLPQQSGMTPFRASFPRPGFRYQRSRGFRSRGSAGRGASQ
ncbi:MAG: hypothetical protein AB2693_27610 [Candidatus Thiodiazotropha sp.]